MFNMSEHTLKQCDCLASQQHLTVKCILNQDYAQKAQNSVSRVEKIPVTAMNALSSQIFKKTGSTSNASKQVKLATFVGTSENKESTRTES